MLKIEDRKGKCAMQTPRIQGLLQRMEEWQQRDKKWAKERNGGWGPLNPWACSLEALGPFEVSDLGLYYWEQLDYVKTELQLLTKRKRTAEQESWRAYLLEEKKDLEYRIGCVKYHECQMGN